MTLNNIKTMKKERGFTIVELLIVIVVIGILAAIVIVAYNGVTQRANTSKNQTNAVSVQKKAEAYAADSSGGNGQFPATAAAFTAVSSTALGAPPVGVTLQSTAPTASTNTSTVQYQGCVTSSQVVGYKVAYWDFTGTPGVKTLSGGDTSGTCS